jgi:hypothetical protein
VVYMVLNIYEKTKYMFMSRHQTAGKSNYIKVANKSFRKVAKFKYLGAIKLLPVMKGSKPCARCLGVGLKSFTVWINTSHSDRRIAQCYTVKRESCHDVL